MLRLVETHGRLRLLQLQNRLQCRIALDWMPASHSLSRAQSCGTPSPNVWVRTRCSVLNIDNKYTQVDSAPRVDAKDSDNTLAEIGQKSAALAAAARIATGGRAAFGLAHVWVVTKESASRGPPRSSLFESSSASRPEPLPAARIWAHHGVNDLVANGMLLPPKRSSFSNDSPFVCWPQPFAKFSFSFAAEVLKKD